MDNVTHALAGVLIGEAAVAWVERRRGSDAHRGQHGTSRAPTTPTADTGGASAGFRRAALIAGIVTAELPDADLLYAGPLLRMGKLGYLLHHRGHTHTVVVALLGALVVWWATLALWRGRLDGVQRRALAVVCAAGVLSHLALDFTNNYGVHPFWPVDDRWFYGDAVFIVEPWLWIAAIPPLLYFTRRTRWRVLLGVLMVSIVVAAWRLPMVDRAAAIALTLGAGVWSAALFPLRTNRIAVVALGAGAWIAVELSFLAASVSARGVVLRDRMASAPTRVVREVALTPHVANPSCFDALIVETEGDRYLVSRGSVAPLGGSGVTASCGVSRGWRAVWDGSLSELTALAQRSCELRAALRFMRVPAWRTRDGDVLVSDLRFGDSGGFAELAVREGSTCPRWVPPWTPPLARSVGLRVR